MLERRIGFSGKAAIATALLLLLPVSGFTMGSPSVTAELEQTSVTNGLRSGRASCLLDTQALQKGPRLRSVLGAGKTSVTEGDVPWRKTGRRTPRPFRTDNLRYEIANAPGSVFLPVIGRSGERAADVPEKAAKRHEGRVPRGCVVYEEKKRVAIPESFGAGSDCHAVAYQAATSEPLELYDIPAWLCFSCDEGRIGRTCFEARTDHYVHQFVHLSWEGFRTKLEVVPILHESEPLEAVLFNAVFSAGGSGWSTLVTLWMYRKDCEQFVNILPEISINRSDEFRLFTGPEDALNGVIVVADYSPAVGERYVDLSPYRITIYRYEDESQRFQAVDGGQFLTTKKYRYKLERGGTTEVIDDQMERIEQVLRQGRRRKP